MRRVWTCAGHSGAQDVAASQQEHRLFSVHHKIITYIAAEVVHLTLQPWCLAMPAYSCTCNICLNRHVAKLTLSAAETAQPATQAKLVVRSLMYAATQLRASLYSSKAQTSAALTQLFSSSGTMLLMPT